MLTKSEVKKCTKCGEVKELAFFYKGNGRLQRASWCKSCMAIKGKEWQSSNKEHVNQRANERRAKNPEVINKYRREFRQKGRDEVSDEYIKTRLNRSKIAITPEIIALKRELLKLKRLTR